MATTDVWAYYGHVEYIQTEGAQPGTEEFIPNKEWLTQKLRVPVTNCHATEKEPGGVDGGISGCRYFVCQVEYGGPATNPTLGLPTELFIKLRQPHQGLDEFATEMVVGYLAKHMTDLPPMARVLWAGPNSVILERLVSKAHGVLLETEEIAQILAAYAKLHACFWRLPHVVGLMELERWQPHFVPLFIPEALGQHRKVLEKFQTEIGIQKIFNHMSSRASTLCQGDAHPGQVLKLKKHSSYAQDHGRWQLIDFATGIVANPAIDVGSIILSAPFNGVEEWRSLLKVYWNALTAHLAEKSLDPEMTYEQFEMYAYVAMGWRVMFYLQRFGNQLFIPILLERFFFDQEIYDAFEKDMAA